MLLAVVFAMSLPAVTARLYSSDEVQYFSYVRSLYFDRDVSFENEYRYFFDHNIAQSAGYHETFLERETAAGRRVNYATMGAAILWMPFYATADVWTRVTGTAEPNGFTQPYVSAVAYGSAFYGFLAILLSVRAARVICFQLSALSSQLSASSSQLSASSSQLSALSSQRSAATARPADVRGDPTTFVAGLVVWFGTPLLFYMYVAPPFSHACSAFAVALFVNVWLHVRRRWTPAGTFALGLATALMAMVREQDAFLALGPLVDFAWAGARGPSEGPEGSAAQRRPRARASGGGAPRALIKAAAAGLAGTLLGYAPQLLAYNALNGYPAPAEHVARKMYWYAPHALQVLASPHHGFFFWTPLALFSMLGLFMLKDRAVSACLLLMVAAQVYVAGSVESWTVAGAFGQRRFVCLTIILVIGIAGLWRAIQVPSDAQSEGRTYKRRAYVLGAAVVLCVWWNVAVMAQFATRLMDRQRLEPARNAYHAFVTLPLRAPSLVYRYLFDRDSFYESRPDGAGR